MSAMKMRVKEQRRRSPVLWIIALAALLAWTGDRLLAEEPKTAPAGGVGAAVKDADGPAAKDGSAGEPKEKQFVPIFHLRDKSRISGKPKLDAIKVETQYGLLTVPRDQLVRVRFVRRLASEIQAKIEQLVNDLGNDDFDKREAASAALAEMGTQALEHLRKAAKSTNEEVKSRAASLVSKINEQGTASQGAEEDSVPALSGTDDEIVSTRMTIKGRVLVDEFAIDSRYGELRVQVSDLSGITFRSASSAAIKIDVSAQNQPPGNWFDSKLDLERGQKLKIEAAGQITVRNYGIVSGPEGNRDWSGHSTFGNFPMLSLVGKIGKKGQPFLVGSNHASKVKAQGRLYLGIVTFSPYPTGAAGSYQVKIQSQAGE